MFNISSTQIHRHHIELINIGINFVQTDEENNRL
uniref:Uncharacterized protein n=1 Tax=viral metagenome TaxID=1070528 RepID=A0A6C0C8M0_9ZZZZ